MADTLKEQARNAEDGIARMLNEFERYKIRMKEEIFEKKSSVGLKRDIKHKIETVGGSGMLKFLINITNQQEELKIINNIEGING
jgi:hypothetical protein